MLSEGLRAARIHEVPNFDGAIAGRCRKQVSTRVELETADPVEMTLTRHYQVARGDGPEFPGGIIRAGGQDFLFRVVSKRSDTHQVTLESFL